MSTITFDPFADTIGVRPTIDSKRTQRRLELLAQRAQDRTPSDTCGTHRTGDPIYRKLAREALANCARSI